MTTLLLSLLLAPPAHAYNVDNDGDGYTMAQGDCHDADPSIHPGALERCDGVDTDCDGQREDLTVDSDGDGIPDDCEAMNGGGDVDGDGFLASKGDCDDFDATIHPFAPEACDGIDSDCDGVAEDLTVDSDGDGIPDDCEALYGGGGDADGDGFPASKGDCDDLDPTVYPGAPERCDGIDSDCDGIAEDLTVDRNGDGIPDDCQQGGPGGDHDGDGWTAQQGDCNDSDPSVHPGAQELCNGADDDCDGYYDEYCTGGWTGHTGGFVDTGEPVVDVDGDGFTTDDCDDLDPSVHPAATEACNGVDDDCDGLVDEGCGGTGGSGTPGGSGGPTTPPGTTPPAATGDTGLADDGKAGCQGTSCAGSGGTYAWLMLFPLGWLGRRR